MKVVYLGCSDSQVSWGNCDDPREVLVVGEEYEVQDEKVYSWHTKIELCQFEGKLFNKVCFRRTKGGTQ